MKKEDRMPAGLFILQKSLKELKSVKEKQGE